MRTFKVIVLILFTILVSVLYLPQEAIAESPESFNLPAQQTLPGSTNYAFKRLKEKITEFFKFSHQGKFVYRQELLAKRLSELVSLIDQQNSNEIANATQRFSYQAGVLAEGSFNDKNENKDAIKVLFLKYRPILEKMRDKFPANSPFWLLAQQDIDTLSILSSKFK